MAINYIDTTCFYFLLLLRMFYMFSRQLHNIHIIVIAYRSDCGNTDGVVIFRKRYLNKLLNTRPITVHYRPSEWGFSYYKRNNNNSRAFESFLPADSNRIIVCRGRTIDVYVCACVLHVCVMFNVCLSVCNMCVCVCLYVCVVFECVSV